MPLKSNFLGAYKGTNILRPNLKLIKHFELP